MNIKRLIAFLLLISLLLMGLTSCVGALVELPGENEKDPEENNDKEKDPVTPPTPEEPGNTDPAPEEPGNTNPTPEEPGNTDPTPEEPGNTDPTPEEPGENEITVTYEQYMAFSSEEQFAFYLSFENPLDFAAWFNDAKAKYDAAHPNPDIGGGDVDIGGSLNQGN